MTDNLDKLWELTGVTREEYKDAYYGFFDPVGLILSKELAWGGGYWSTPVNTVSFGRTGGDGIHFSFLKEKDDISNESPIVMTLPSADTSNIIVGESLIDFLSLGCRAGYFELGQVEYRLKEHIPFMESKQYPPDYDDENINRLKLIEKGFDISPWNEIIEKLAKLNEKYIGKLMYSEEYYEITT